MKPETTQRDRDDNKKLRLAKQRRNAVRGFIALMVERISAWAINTENRTLHENQQLGRAIGIHPK